MLNASSKESKNEVATGKGWPNPVVAFILTIVLFLVSQVFGALIISLIQSLTGDDKTAELDLFGSTVVLQFVFAFLVYGFLLASISWYARRRQIGRRELGLVKPQLSALGYASIAFIIYIASFALLQSIVSVAIPGLDLDQKQDTGFGDATGAGVLPLMLTFIALVILAPLAEEVLMRGFLFGSLRRKLPFWIATLIVSSLFAVLHLGGGEAGSGLLWVAAIDTFLLSIVLCYLREKTGQLWASIALHMLKNGVAFFVLFIVGVNP